MLNGYRVILVPNHPKAMRSNNWNGYVYEHIVVAENKLGRSLCVGEHVHHIDKNRANNAPENLAILSNSAHSLTHGAERRKTRPICICGKATRTMKNIYCSRACDMRAKGFGKCPDKETLMFAMRNNSMCAVGRMFGVSDNAVRKWARKYGLLPSKEVNNDHHNAPVEL